MIAISYYHQVRLVKLLVIRDNSIISTRRYIGIFLISVFLYPENSKTYDSLEDHILVEAPLLSQQTPFRAGSNCTMLILVERNHEILFSLRIHTRGTDQYHRILSNEATINTESDRIVIKHTRSSLIFKPFLRWIHAPIIHNSSKHLTLRIDSPMGREKISKLLEPWSARNNSDIPNANSRIVYQLWLR